MKTNIAESFLQTPQGELANRILRSCVHCGFCNATCPTYQLLGDELDGPRGRIYLIKQMLEGETASRKTQLHLDRCLSCRNCESTCPSGVKYSQLLDIGRAVTNEKVPRSFIQRTQHFLLRKLFLSSKLFSLLLKTGQTLRPALPASLKKAIPEQQKKLSFQQTSHTSKVLLIPGCVQPSLKANIDIAAKIVLDKFDIECIEPDSSRCCGSLSHHLNAEKEALDIIRSNIDHWLPLIKKHDIEAICMTASGCGVAIKEYEQLLAFDQQYSDKAKTISALYKDPAEIIREAIDKNRQSLQQFKDANTAGKDQIIAFHPPCTLQHGMRIKRIVEPILENCGFSLQPFKDSHLCCGSAGTYSITQKTISQQLLSNKLKNIDKNKPDIIATANIGCQLHLQSGTSTPVKHWLELLL